jgi:DNA processing protein
MTGEITIESAKYPNLLKDLKDAPAKLYYKGSIDTATFANCLAVVGSRKISLYGSRVVNRFIPEICSSGISIVSGFMYGVDALAHSTALDSGGKTIAVLPCGVEIICPSEQHSLYQRILDTKNVFLSEYPAEALPKIWTFPRRNRLVAGVCKSVLVIEASATSGSLITARIALKLKRKVFVIPGDVFSEGSEGIYQLIKEGAEIIDTPKDIIAYYFPTITTANSFKAKKLEIFDQLGQRIYGLLKARSMSLNELVEASSISFNEVGPCITQLELDGFINCHNGLYYVS